MSRGKGNSGKSKWTATNTNGHQQNQMDLNDSKSCPFLMSSNCVSNRPKIQMGLKSK